MREKKKLIITVDTEADNQWQYNGEIKTENAKFLPRFQDMCVKYGFCPTYLTTYEMAADPYYICIMRDYVGKGEAEVGAHLHPWTNPPYAACDGHKEKYTPYPSELSLELFECKLHRLKCKLEETFLKPVISYRAGRWGLIAEHVPILLKYGFQVDCSVTPLISWKHVLGRPGGDGGSDFTDAPCCPYFLDANDICNKTTSGLLEVPPTVTFAKNTIWDNYLKGNTTHLLSRVAKHFGYGPQWLRPLPYNSVKSMVRVISAWSKENDYLEMMLHSSELMPKGSPYYKTEADIDRLYAKIEKLFRKLSIDDVQGVTLGQYANIYLNRRPN